MSRKTIAKYLSFKGDITTLVIFALKEIENGNVTEDELQRINKILFHESNENIIYDAALAPEWISDILKKANIVATGVKLKIAMHM